MKVLIAVKGAEGESFFARAAALVRLETAREVILAHVIDATHRQDMALGREHFLGHRGLPSSREADLDRAEAERAQAGLQFARQALIAAGVPENSLREERLRGKPNEEIRHLAEREGVDLIVVGGRGGRPGPHSLGKTARFLIDHAPVAALLIREAV